MSIPEGMPSRRKALLSDLANAGRELSDAAVMFHTALGERLGLGASDWKMLGLLERHGSLTAGDLASHSGLAPASITGIIDRLERAGWVRRTRDPDDGRRVVVSLNPGIAAKKAAPYFGGLMQRLGELYARYNDDELSLILEFVQEVARRQKEATLELTGEPPANERRS